MTSSSARSTWSEAAKFCGFASAAIAVLVVIFYDSLAEMVATWANVEEYGYGYLIPVLSAFLIWQKYEDFAKSERTGLWVGVLVTSIGLLTSFVGQLATLHVVVQYGVIITVMGLVWSLVGWPGFRLVAIPMALMFFMIPLPQFLYQQLSGRLQLISSELGVSLIRIFGISVFLEGNVIDLGLYKLQVVEACSGLRYLFPLATLAFISAYIFKAPLWMRIVVFLSSVPITIVMNSFRIGMIGILVEFWGEKMAEGFLHFFEGWVIFLGCMGILFIEMALLIRVNRKGSTLTDVFAIDLPRVDIGRALNSVQSVPASFMTATASVALIGAITALVPDRPEITPERKSFAAFPAVIDGWTGTSAVLEKVYLDVLKLDDYLMMNYRDADGFVINFYVAYYASQSAGQSAHSPRSCIPGGGWQIEELAARRLDGVMAGGQAISVNRVTIRKGHQQQVVYYWFQQRGRFVTNEYLVKWYLFWDSLTKRRSDGALVRLVYMGGPEFSTAEIDERLASFVRQAAPLLQEYIPK